MPDAFRTLDSRTWVIDRDDIDTDQIIPARFLTTTSRKGLGNLAFHDWRFDAKGNPVASEPLNTCDTDTHKILVAGRNFGCGSSREHAPWALSDFGFKAVISSRIADIFRSNAARNGLLPIVAPETAHAWLLAHPDLPVRIDLENQTVTAKPGPTFGFDIDPFAKHCLLNGQDPLGYLLGQANLICEYEAAHAL